MERHLGGESSTLVDVDKETEAKINERYNQIM